MKILELITLGETGGAQTVLVDILNGISSRGCQVEFDVVFGPGDYLPNELESSFTGTVMQVPWLTRNINLFTDVAALTELWQLCKTKKYDIIHCHSSKASWLGRIVGFLSGTPRICVTVHGLSFGPSNNHLIRSFYKGIERLAIPLASEYIFVSSKDIGEMNKIGLDPNKCHLVPNGRPTPPKPAASLKELLSLPVTNPIVCMVARLTKVKNPLSFIKIAELVMRNFPSEQPGPVFILIGDGPMLNACREAVINAGLQSNFRLLGEKSVASQYFWDADIAVLTSEYEACPLVIIEAMATGTPVVASNVGGAGDIVRHGETGFLYNHGYEEEAAKSIVYLLRDNDLRRTMGENALRTYEASYTVDKMVEEYIRLFGL